jgi:hypothetical protein
MILEGESDGRARSARLGDVADTQPQPGFDVECPHCHKSFSAETMEGSAPRYRGFKCPHCRLFVPFARAEERDLIEPTRRDPAA